MEVEKFMRGSVTVVALIGELNSYTAAGVHVSLQELLPREGSVLLDLSRTSFMSSAGLRVLLLVYRQAREAGVRVALAGMSRDVNDVMTATGFLESFTVAATVDDGVEALVG